MPKPTIPAPGKPTSHALEKLAAAVDQLTTGRGRIKERVHHACVHGICRIDPDELPPELQAELTQLLKLIRSGVMTESKGPTESEGSIAASLDAMTEEQLVEIACRIQSIEQRAR